MRGTWGIGASGTECGSDYTVARHGHGGKDATNMQAIAYNYAYVRGSLC